MSGFKPVRESGTGAGAFIEESKNDPSLNYPKTKKKKWEDNYTRATFYVQNDILDEVNRLAGTEKGEKTRIVNEALQAYLRRK